MADIPEDIMKTARGVCREMQMRDWRTGETNPESHVASAIWAERKRCYGEALSRRNPTFQEIGHAILNPAATRETVK